MFLILIQEEINAFIELSHLNNNKLTVFKNPTYNNLRDPAITLSLITLRRERAKTDIKTLAKILVLGVCISISLEQTVILYGRQ